MDLRIEVQPLAQEYLATRDEDTAWLCEWLDVRVKVIAHVREIRNC